MSRETQKPEVLEFLFEYKFQVPLSYIGKYLNHKHPELNMALSQYELLNVWT